jgi:hypothetical protein
LLINLTPFRFLFGNPIPFIPFPLIRGRGTIVFRRGISPFRLSLLIGEGEETLERGEAPLLPTIPLPLIREGGQGDRLLNDL